MEGAPTLNSLSPRERDCLRLLQAGFHTAHAASSLGISISTLNKHLTSARRKLGVTRTVEALLLLPTSGENSRSNGGRASGAPLLDDFESALEPCTTFDETWAVIHAYAALFGVTHMTCGICAEPPGQLTNGARAIAMSHPDPMLQMYRAMGGERADPTVPYTVTQTRGVLVDNERLIGALKALPKPVASFGQALLDQRMRYSYHKPERDTLTGAPMVAAFFIDPREVGKLRDPRSPVRGLLQAMSRSFLDAVQGKRMLRRLPGLTPRQVEALTLAARGFSVAEMAEHMCVSQRSAEKVLAAARDRLGARNTPAAIYRAMVYRALD